MTSGPAERPTVSLLVAVRNEERYIEACLASIFAQDYPADRLEVLVMDGRSTDRTRHIVEGSFAGRERAHLVDNPQVTQAAGWNIGIEAATGDVVGIVGGHTELEPGYVSTGVETLERTGADIVGGLMRAVGETPVAEAIALATSTPFGVGGARFHYTDREERVDTVYMGLCRRETYLRFRFDEEMVRDQDDELSYRILDAGGTIVCNPAIRSRYRNRATLRTLWRQYHEYGYWKVRVMQKHPGQIRLRHLVPGAFVAALAGSAVLAPLSPLTRAGLVAVVAAYAIADLGATWRWALTADRRLVPLVAVVFPILHVAYGAGFLRGLVAFRNRWARGEGSSSGPQVPRD